MSAMNQYFVVNYEGEWKLSNCLDNSEEQAAQYCFGVRSWQCERVVPVGQDHDAAVQQMIRLRYHNVEFAVLKFLAASGPGWDIGILYHHLTQEGMPEAAFLVGTEVTAIGAKPEDIRQCLAFLKKGPKTNLMVLLNGLEEDGKIKLDEKRFCFVED